MVLDVTHKEPRGWSSIKIITVQRKFCLRSKVRNVTSYATLLQPRGPDNHLVRLVAICLRAHVYPREVIARA